MKATVTKSDLVLGINRAAGALPQRPSSLQILQNILLEFDPSEGIIRATATDLEIAVVVEIPATVKIQGSTTLPGKKLQETIRELPEGEISLTGNDKNTMTLKCGKARAVIKGIGREEYPGLPVLSDGAKGAPQIDGAMAFKAQASVLKNAIKKTIVGASHDEARQFLTGASLVITAKKTEFVATDGHRLAICDFKTETKLKKGDEINVIIPLRILSELSSNLPDDGIVEVQVGDTQILFVSESGIYYSRLVAEKFPDYEKIIPKSTDRKIAISRRDLIDALRCVSPFSNPRTHAVLVSIKSDRLIIKAETPEFGEGQDEVEADIKGGSALDISFNSNYLMDGLKVLKGEDLQFEVGAKISPAVLTSEEDSGFRYILMPLRQ
ncbi:MAG: DNA polymerase III subunit beta [Candidatus Lindowbacteria bacterium]|nr:DNA polymerase III subunit beta [Candidatus Lindowbacteria bacterium]